MEEVLFESERRMTREEIADMLRTVADKLDTGSDVTLSAGADEVTVAPPARPTFEVKVERETEGGQSELSVEFELEWDESENAEDRGELSIE